MGRFLISAFIIILPIGAQISPYQQAISYVQQGKPADAIRILERILVDTPGDLRARRSGRAFRSRRDRLSIRRFRERREALRAERRPLSKGPARVRQLCPRLS